MSAKPSYEAGELMMAEPVPTIIADVLAHPGWADEQWRDDDGRDLFDAMVRDQGYDRASELWQSACLWVDHLAEHDAGQPVECDGDCGWEPSP